VGIPQVQEAVDRMARVVERLRAPNPESTHWELEETCCRMSRDVYLLVERNFRHNGFSADLRKSVSELFSDAVSLLRRDPPADQEACVYRVNVLRRWSWIEDILYGDVGTALDEELKEHDRKAGLAFPDSGAASEDVEP